MNHNNGNAIIAAAVEKVADMSPQQTDCAWLETVTEETAPHIK